MPARNRFFHQVYLPQPALQPSLHTVSIDDGDGVDFSNLHSVHGVREVVIVHGTFMGNDSFAVAEILKAIGDSVPVLKRPLSLAADQLRERIKPATDQLTGDIANYTPAFQERFQQLVGSDPSVHLLDPPWSGQNHHFARADLAVRLLCRLSDLQPAPAERVLFWGHSHAGNGFALLSNLLANDRPSVQAFFDAGGSDLPDHWQRAADILLAAPSPHPWAQSTLMCAFGTPVRYGWDPRGYDQLLHILHHRNYSEDDPFRTKPLFPPHNLTDTLTARFGDWVQAFAIAGTDVSSPAAMAQNRSLTELLEAGLPEPEHGFDTRFIVPKRVRDACRRWKEGTRCHADGQNLLVEYKPSGLKTPLGNPLEHSVLGHGVATTMAWLPAHLALILKSLRGPAAQPL